MIAFEQELQEFLDLAGPACEEAFVAEMDKIAVKKQTFELLQRANRAQRGKGFGVLTPGKSRKPTIRLDTQQGSSRGSGAVRDFFGPSSVQRAALGDRMAPPISAPPPTFTSSTGTSGADRAAAKGRARASRSASDVRGVPDSLKLPDDSGAMWMSPELRGALDSPPSMLLPRVKSPAPRPVPATQAPEGQLARNLDDPVMQEAFRGIQSPTTVTGVRPGGAPKASKKDPPSSAELLASWTRRGANKPPVQTGPPRVPPAASPPTTVTGARPGGAPAAQESAEQAARGAPQPEASPWRGATEGTTPARASDDQVSSFADDLIGGHISPSDPAGRQFIANYPDQVEKALLARQGRTNISAENKRISTALDQTARAKTNKKPSPGLKSDPPGASTPTPTPEGVSTPPGGVRERASDAVRGTTAAAREKMQQATTFLDEVIASPTKENLAKLKKVWKDVANDPSIVGRKAGEKLEQVGQGARALTDAAESIRYGVSPELLGGIKTIRNTADEFAAVSRQLAETGAKFVNGKWTQTRKPTSRIPGMGYTDEAAKAEQQLVDDLVDRRNQLAQTMMDRSSTNPGLKGVVDDFIRNPSDEAIARLNSDAIFTTAGGNPVDPRVASVLEDVLHAVIPPSSAARGADEAAEGLAAALKDMDPAYLAAAAGAAGLGTGMVLG